MILENIRIALTALRVNMLRSILTMLGIIIGVAAVVSMIALGVGTQQRLAEEINRLGTNVLTVYPGAMSAMGRSQGSGSAANLSLRDADALAREIADVEFATGSIQTRQQLIAGNQNWVTSIRGVEPEMQIAQDWRIARGRFITHDDLRSNAKVIVLGKTVAEELFGLGDPIGALIRLERLPVRVIGVLESKGGGMFGDSDNVALMPYTTLGNRVVGTLRPSSLTVKIYDGASMNAAATAIEDVLRSRLDVPAGGDDPFTVQNFAELLEASSRSMAVFTMFLGGVASIALLVGGIGVLNIMLVSITERTREIGLRMALGARPRDIRLQFLIEAMLLSTIGGIAGILLSYGVAGLIAALSSLPAQVPLLSVGIALVLSTVIGTLFGYYPATRAARLDPIEALRYE